jgi:hypothetical protein
MTIAQKLDVAWAEEHDAGHDHVCGWHPKMTINRISSVVATINEVKRHLLNVLH